jgi:hypothetical protein
VKTKLVNQKYDWDCYIACLAMFLDSPYSEIFEAYHNLIDKKYYNGITDKQASDLLKIAGVKPIIKSKIIQGVKGIVTVPSLNDENGFHVIYFNGKRFLDPNHSVEGKKFYRQKVPYIISVLYDKDDL